MTHRSQCIEAHGVNPCDCYRYEHEWVQRSHECWQCAACSTTTCDTADASSTDECPARLRVALDAANERIADYDLRAACKEIYDEWTDKCRAADARADAAEWRSDQWKRRADAAEAGQQRWAAVHDEVNRLDTRSGGDMAADDTLPLVLRTLRSHTLSLTPLPAPQSAKQTRGQDEPPAPASPGAGTSKPKR